MQTYSASEWLVALHHVPGVGWHTIKKIKAICGTFDQLPARLNERASELASLRVPWRELAEQLQSDETKQTLRRLREKNIRIMTVLDEHYPVLLKEIAQPPWVLYVLGSVSLLKDPAAIAIVGTRRPTPYGKKVAHRLAYGLAERRFTVVSGMALGIDAEAHKGALAAGGRTVAVLGCGVDVIYPKSNRPLYRELIHSGAVISEFPPGTAPRPGHFPQRNRIISGLSRGTVVVEAQEKSGSLITADMSVDQNRDVFAVPGPITSSRSVGTNRLIQQGAVCVTSVEDILAEYPDMAAKTNQPVQTAAAHAQLTMEEAAVLEHLEAEPVHLDELCSLTSLSVTELHPVLLSLQVKRLIKQLPGQQFVQM